METKSNRLTFFEYGLLMAINSASRSPDPHTQVGGAVFRVDNKRFLSSGYNGLNHGQDWPEQFNVDRNLKGELVIHCEQNLKLQEPDIEKIVFLSMSPCFSCSKLLCSPLNRVVEVIYLRDWERDKEQKFKEVFNFYNIKYRAATKEEIKNIIECQKNNLTKLEKLIN